MIYLLGCTNTLSKVLNYRVSPRSVRVFLIRSVILVPKCGVSGTESVNDSVHG